MDNSQGFIAEWLEQKYLTFAELCTSYGISRKTGYKWVGRFKAQGLSGIQERRRGTGSHPWKTDDTMTRQIIALRRKRPRWGPKKALRVAEVPRLRAAGAEHGGVDSEAGRAGQAAEEAACEAR